MFNCRVCGENDCSDWLYEEKNCLLCTKCEAIFKENPPDHKTQFLDEVGDIHTLKEIIGTKIISRRFWEIVAGQYYTYLKTKTKLNFNNALDVGALYGHFVSKLNQNGIDATGLEADRNYLRSVVTNKVEWGYFDETYNTDTKYDLICFTQMLYYVKDPMMTLVHAKNMLKDGLIFISTQNPSSSTIKNKKIPQIIESGMNILFSKKNFESLEDKIGLELIDYTTYRPEIFLERFRSSGAKDEILNYLKFHWKKAYQSDPNGHHAFVLLKPVR